MQANRVYIKEKKVQSSQHRYSQFSSVSQSCLTLCNLTECSTLDSLSITNFRSLLKLISLESVTPSNHLILCHPLFLLPSIFPSIRVFSKELVLHIRWPKCWSFSFSIHPSNEYSFQWFALGLTGLISLQRQHKHWEGVSIPPEIQDLQQFMSLLVLICAFLVGSCP